MSNGNGLSNIEHLVVLMLENRSFDHMLGFLYTDQANVSPAGQAYEGLTGEESNPDENGKLVTVRRIEASDPNPYFMPGADPGEGYGPTNAQLFATLNPPAPPVATMQGFVTNFADTLNQRTQQRETVLPGTVADDIMGCFTPDTLPVLSALARGYAVCDQWFSSVPTETLPNRAFACAATSQGHMDDHTRTFTCPSIFGRLSDGNVGWNVYGDTVAPMTRHNFPDISGASDDHFGLYGDFQKAAAANTLPAFTFLEPTFASTGNSEHPVGDVALGEQLIQQVYRTLHDGPGWNQTLLVITYDEHGGCYDHVPPPVTSTPPNDGTTGEFGFDFTRFGVRVPTVLVSPLIVPGTVFRSPDGAPPLDHTSILRTVEQRWTLSPLTARDAATSDIGAVLTLGAPRTDDVLAGVNAPPPAAVNPAAAEVSHLQQVHADLVARQLIPGGQKVLQRQLPSSFTPQAYADFIKANT
ncbi:alkaline phosphatase family protein [Kitasatospora sp. NPDC053057]|uniref:alkaline phosphatase family protein n=1 Tax=Kitasatospora sp. NPDC053057 TaxID=3364062 RepID=UPI0037CC9FF9